MSCLRSTASRLNRRCSGRAKTPAGVGIHRPGASAQSHQNRAMQTKPQFARSAATDCPDSDRLPPPRDPMPRPATPETIAEAVRPYQTGHSMRYVQATLHVGQRTLQKALKAAGVSVRPRRLLTAGQAKRALRLYVDEVKGTRQQL